MDERWKAWWWGYWKLCYFQSWRSKDSKPRGLSFPGEHGAVSYKILCMEGGVPLPWSIQLCWLASCLGWPLGILRSQRVWIPSFPILRGPRLRAFSSKKDCLHTRLVSLWGEDTSRIWRAQASFRSLGHYGMQKPLTADAQDPSTYAVRNPLSIYTFLSTPTCLTLQHVDIFSSRQSGGMVISSSRLLSTML